MGTLELLVGISGSGKSAYGKEQWGKSPKNVVLVSRDAVRQLLFGYNDLTLSTYYSRKDIVGREKAVTENIDELIRFNLGKGKHVIVDNTHLKLSYIEAYQKFNVPTSLTVFTTEKTTCLERDFKRVKAVGSKVIERQYNQLKTLCNNLLDNAELVGDNYKIENYDFTTRRFQYKINPDLEYCVVVDIDGTIAEKGSRSPYDMNKVHKDTEKSNITDVVRALSQKGYHIIICTGRDGTGAEKSKQWLNDKSIPYGGFYIREAGDMRPDFVVKEEMWQEITKEFNILTMIDDRRQVIDHARSLGFTVMDVAGHTF